MLPPPSQATAMGAMPAATTAALPELDPPGDSERSTLAVVGAGACGIAAASELKRAAISWADIAVLERGGRPGGVWANFANASSVLQTPTPGYFAGLHGSLAFGDDAPLFASRADIQKEVEQLVASESLDVTFGVEVVGLSVPPSLDAPVELAIRRVPDDGAADGGRSTLKAAAVLFATGDLAVPRAVRLPGELSFEGWVAGGICDDTPPSVLRGRSVAVIGAGAFAVENVRTALLAGAAHVTVVARRAHTVVPRLSVRYLEGHAPFSAPGAQEAAKSVAHSFGGVTDLFAHNHVRGHLEQDVTPACSDFLFLALRARRVSYVVGGVAEVVPNGLRTDRGAVVEADLILKCCGFEHSEASVRQAAPFDELRGLWLDGDPRVAAFTGAQFRTARPPVGRSPLVSQTAVARIAAAHVAHFAHQSRRVRFVHDVAPALPASATMSVDNVHFAATAHALNWRSMRCLAASIRVVATVCLAHLSVSHAAFYEQCAAEWAEQAYQLGFAPGNEPPYPFSPPSLRDALRDATSRLCARYLLLLAWQLQAAAEVVEAVRRAIRGVRTPRVASSPPSCP